MSERVFAAAAHPDDIEFMMAGTLMLLGEAGFELHTQTIANGSCGSISMGRDETVRVRSGEARRAAEVLGAAHHDPLVDDLQIFYTPELLARLAAIVRTVAPTILLIPSPQDYMEDHTNTCRLMVAAAFARNMPNFPTDPPTPVVDAPVAVYHAMPAWLRGPLAEPVRPDFCVDVSSVCDRKRRALSCHASQSDWLDKSQGVGSYVRTMEELSAEVARTWSPFAHAEGWRRHLPAAFCPPDFDPLREALGDEITAPCEPRDP